MNEREETIDLRILLKVLKTRFIFIIIAALAAGIAGFSIAAFAIDKQYTSSALLYVENSANKANEAINVNDISAAQKLVDTCQILFTSDYILNELSDALGGKYSASALKGMVTVESVDSTEVLRISVTTASPTISADIATKLTELSRSEFIRVIKSGSIEVVSPAAVPTGHTYPDVKKFTAIGAMGGLVCCYGIFLLIELFNTKVKDSDDLAAIYNVPVFAEIMDFEALGKGKGKYSYSKYGGSE